MDPISILAAIGLQFVSGFVNSMNQKTLSKKIAKAQQDFEEKATLQGIEQARAEFKQLCSLQRELESQMQNDRIQQIKDNLYSNLELIAYEKSLENFPLLVPPFVMKNESLPYLSDFPVIDNRKVAMHCILTNCMDTQFNTRIFPELEERLSTHFCKYWNISSSHPILFYQGGWRDTIKDARPYLSNLKAQLSTIPTLVISPIITEKDGLFFQFSCWGMGMGNSNEFSDNSIYVPSNLQIAYSPNRSYTDEEVSLSIEELAPVLEAFIGYFADLYYWFYYNMPPLQPSLIIKNKIILNSSLFRDYYKQYIDVIILNTEDDSSNNSRKGFSECLKYLLEAKDFFGFDKTEKLLTMSLNNLLSGDKKNQILSISGLLCSTDILDVFEPEDIECMKQIINL